MASGLAVVLAAVEVELAVVGLDVVGSPWLTSSSARSRAAVAELDVEGELAELAGGAQHLGAVEADLAVLDVVGMLSR